MEYQFKMVQLALPIIYWLKEYMRVTNSFSPSNFSIVNNKYFILDIGKSYLRTNFKI